MTMKFITKVPDEVGEKFQLFCASKGKSPYDILSDLLHKVTNIPRNPTGRALPSELAKRNVQGRISAKLVELKAADRRLKCPFCSTPGDPEDAATCIGRGRCNQTGKFLVDE